MRDNKRLAAIRNLPCIRCGNPDIQKAELAAKVAAYESKQQTTELKRPVIDDFEDFSKYEEALEDYHAAKAEERVLARLNERESQKAATAQEAEFQTAMDELSDERISNHAIETALSNYVRTDDAYAFSYQSNGHSFYVISFPTDLKTWCFDATTGMWHERSYYNSTDSVHEHHRAQCHCFFEGEHLVGDRSNGKVYKFDQNSETDAPICKCRHHLFIHQK